MSEEGWLQLSMEAGAYSVEQLEDALLQVGALAVTLQDGADQPVLEPAPGATPLWPHTNVTGLFDAQTDIGVLKRRLQQVLHSATLPACHLTALEQRNWVRAWLEHFQPLRFGERLWICPTAYAPPDPSAVNVRLDPGLAFGTGTHPSTALCLEWLANAQVSGKTVLDYGCGSGILAIAAAKLGAQRVWAVDIDPQALLACDANASENEVEERLVLLAPHALADDLRVEILLANILAGILLQLAAEFAARVHSGGRIVLSGILAADAASVQAAFARHFTFRTLQLREGWVLLDGIRNA